MRFKLIACEILYREVCWAVSRSPHRVDVTFMPKGLHDLGQPGMFSRLKSTLDGLDLSGYDALLLAYGLCNNGIVGLVAREIPLVVPRAHDCITLFFGSKERYLEYFYSHPGVYFKTTGWIERGESLEQLGPQSVRRRTGLDMTFEEMVAKYGEDNARYLWEQLQLFTHRYHTLVFIEMGIEPDDRFEQQVREEAARRGWNFEKVRGDLRLIRQLVDGQWDEADFLVVPPGYAIAPSFDERIVIAEPVATASPKPAD
ncbi:MAG: DUF1638 domain-containing protein [Thermoguttaceae bacterium]|nr:DUF1638 domain-containing protein [Thermoguttaceae bacterium]MDW8079645.1 DUF1638 domain-containing protein [Thermoguttaceae bacterium]